MKLHTYNKLIFPCLIFVNVLIQSLSLWGGGSLTGRGLLSILQEPGNQDLLDFTTRFAARLRDANPNRVAHSGMPSAGSDEQFVSQGDRRLDAMARLLEGDEVCAAVAFDRGKLLVATNNNGHSMDRFNCPLWDRIFTLHGHLTMIAKMSMEANQSIPRHQWTPQTREDFVGEALPYKLIRTKSTFKEMKKAQLDEIQELREFSWRVNNDFFKFEESSKAKEASEANRDIVEAWAEDCKHRIASLTPPNSIARNSDRFFETAIRLYQDLIKLEDFFSTMKHLEPYATELVQAMATRKIDYSMINVGAQNVHAEMRLTSHAVTQGIKFPYIGISKLCCAYCNLVMDTFLKAQYFEADDAMDVPTRGRHGVPYPWLIPEPLRNYEPFIKELLGSDLYAIYAKFKIEAIILAGGQAPLNKGDFALSVLEALPLITFDNALRTEAERIGLSLPIGERPLEATPSIDYSATPIYIHRRKAFYLFDEKRVVDDRDAEFHKLQVQLSSQKTVRAFLFDQKEIDSHPELWYGDNHVNGLLNHYLPAEARYTVIPPAAAIFDNDHLLREATLNALQSAIAGNTAVMPMHLHGNHWSGAVFKVQKEGDNITGIHVVFNNPQGYVIDLEPNAIAFVQTIQSVAEEITPGVAPTIIDLFYKQQINGNDCGPLMVDTLVKLASTPGIEGLTTREDILAAANLFSGNADNIREIHSPIFEGLGLPTPTLNPAIDIDDVDEWE
jgi:hypothetical protein